MTMRIAKHGPNDSRDVGEAATRAGTRRSQGAIKWEDNDKADYFVGTIGPAKFEINGGVGGMFGAVFSFAGDCYAVLSTAKTVEEAKRFCEWIARSYGLDRITDQPAGLT
jgi:hypothetical protein